MFEFLMLIGFFCAGLCQLLPQQNKAAKKPETPHHECQRSKTAKPFSKPPHCAKRKKNKKIGPDLGGLSKNRLTFSQYSLYKKVN